VEDLGEFLHLLQQVDMKRGPCRGLEWKIWESFSTCCSRWT
jgi:hypothetical protein